MKTRTLLCFLLLGWLLTVSSTRGADRLNVVYILSENQSYYEMWRLGFSYPQSRHLLGASECPEVVLNGMDWYAGSSPWARGHFGKPGNGKWAVTVKSDGRYVFECRRFPREADKAMGTTHARIQVGKATAQMETTADAKSVRFEMDLKAGEYDLQTWLRDGEEKPFGALFVYVSAGHAQAADNRQPAASPQVHGRVRVAGIVAKWVRGDKAANYRRVEPMIREAAKNGAQIVCTTECFLDGYAIADKSIPLQKYRALGEAIPGGVYFRKLQALAKELRIQLIAGMLEADGEKRFNTAVIISPEGKLIGKYRKQHLGHELERNTPGDRSLVFSTSHGDLGVMICADRRFPKIVNAFIKNGAKVLICPSGGMFGSAKNDPILQARSRETKRYIVFVHPAEFLVTAPDGSIASRTILGKQLLVSPSEFGTEADSNRVFYFDLPKP